MTEEVALVPELKEPVSVVGTFTNKNVLITGATGFVGKVILEKILRSIPNVGCVFVVIRAQKGQTADARLEKEIMNSEIFKRLRTELGPANWNAFKAKKVRAVTGDMTQQQCGFSAETLAMLRAELDIVIHCAAVVEFHERIDKALEMNCHGTLRLLEIAQNCPRVGAFIHVSTAYVNSNRPPGDVEEKLYSLGFDPDKMVEKIQKINNVSKLEKIVDTGILGDWPNTYTFTKAITEHLVVRRRGRLPVVIVRPSIVAGSWIEPQPGWVDVISAAGAVYMAVGLGILKFLPGDPNNIADVVPVDTVCNIILCSVANIWQQDRYYIAHAGSSAQNPMHWGDANIVHDYFRHHPPEKAISAPEFKFMRTPQAFQVNFFLRYSLPSTLLNTLALVGSQSQKDKAKLYQKMVFRVRVVIESFKHFVMNSWIFDQTNALASWQNVVPQEQGVFSCSLDGLNWERYNENFAYGLIKHVMKEDLVDVDGEVTALFHSVSHEIWTKGTPKDETLTWLMPDLKWVKEKIERFPEYPQGRTPQAMMKKLLSSPEVTAAMENEVANGFEGKATTKEAVRARAENIMKQMFADPHMPTIGGLGYFFRKVWRRIYTNIRVDSLGVQKVKEAASKGPIIYIPTHRSYIDFLVVSYICLNEGLPLPHIAAGEDFLGILLVRYLFRRSGAFFLRRTFIGGSDELYATIFKSYVRTLLSDGQSLEFFIEGTRSRSGKMLHPKMGLLSIITSAFFDPDGGLGEVSVVPVSIGYERTMEGDLYSNELLGDSKIKESLRALLSSSSVLTINFGRIAVAFGDPIPLTEYTEQLTNEMNKLKVIPVPRKLTPLNISTAAGEEEEAPEVLTSLNVSASQNSSSAGSSSPGGFSYEPATNRAHFQHFNRMLAYDVVWKLNEQCPIFSTSLVATLMLMYRQGITRPQLIDKTDWLRKELRSRGCTVFGVQGQTRAKMTEASIDLLRHLFVSRHNVIEPAITARHEYKNMLVLGHYKNKIAHFFYMEGLFACAVYSFGELAHQGVNKKDLMTEVEFLSSLLSREFIYKRNPDTPEDFEATLKTMVSRNILAVREQGPDVFVEVANAGETHFSLLCAMFWPYIDSYFATVMALFSLQPHRVVEESMLKQRAQWLATTLYQESMLCFYEACSLETIGNALSVLRGWKVVHIFQDKKTKKDMVELREPFHTEHALQELVERIGRLRKPPPVGKKAPRRHLIADIPVLAKL